MICQLEALRCEKAGAIGSGVAIAEHVSAAKDVSDQAPCQLSDNNA
jgi:hypothetical protein